LNFFSAADQSLIETLARGEFNLRGFQNKSLRAHPREKTSRQVSRLFKSLRLHGLAKKVGHTYRYYLTSLGKYHHHHGIETQESRSHPPARTCTVALIHVFCPI